MAVMLIYGKCPSKIFFSRTLGLISTKLGMQHRGLQLITVCSTDDHGKPFTYFTERLICKLGFYMGNRENNGYCINYCSLRLERFKMQTTNGVTEGMQSIKVNAILILAQGD